MNVKIVCSKEYVAGWLDTSIHEFLEALSPNVLSTTYALITCLDSNPNPALLRNKSRELKSVANKLEIHGSALLLPTDLLLATDSRNRIFFGFDEVWFLPNKSVQRRLASTSLVGPARINKSRFKSVSKWMSDNACPLALGDGEGLNFVVQAHGLVGSLLGHSIEQPDPFLAPLENLDPHEQSSSHSR